MKWIFCLFAFSLCAGQIKLSNEILNVEVANTEELRTKGLSGRTSLPEGTGMLFIFDKPHTYTFWMKDTKIALSIGFFDKEQTLLQHVDMMPEVKSTSHVPTYKSPPKTLYALEVPMGWFRKNQCQPGDKFQWLDKGQIR